MNCYLITYTRYVKKIIGAVAMLTELKYTERKCLANSDLELCRSYTQVYNVLNHFNFLLQCFEVNCVECDHIRRGCISDHILCSDFRTKQNILITPIFHRPCILRYFLLQKPNPTWKRFQDAEEIQVNATGHLLAISKKELQACFWQWKQHWMKCFIPKEDYFEGDYMPN